MFRFQRGPLELLGRVGGVGHRVGTGRRGHRLRMVIGRLRARDIRTGICRVDSTIDGGRVRRRRGRRRHRRLLHGSQGGTAGQACRHRRARRSTGRHLPPPWLHPDEGAAAVGGGDGHGQSRGGMGHQGLRRPRLVGGARVRGQDRRQAGQGRHRADQDPRDLRREGNREAPRRGRPWRSTAPRSTPGTW